MYVECESEVHAYGLIRPHVHAILALLLDLSAEGAFGNGHKLEGILHPFFFFF